MDIGTQPHAAPGQPHQQHHRIQRQNQRRHVGQQQVHGRVGRGSGQRTRADGQRSPAAAKQPQQSQHPAVRALARIAVVRAAVLILAVQILFKVVEVGALLFLLALAVRHQTIPVRS